MLNDDKSVVIVADSDDESDFEGFSAKKWPVNYFHNISGKLLYLTHFIRDTPAGVVNTRGGIIWYL